MRSQITKKRLLTPDSEGARRSEMSVFRVEPKPERTVDETVELRRWLDTTELAYDVKQRIWEKPQITMAVLLGFRSLRELSVFVRGELGLDNYLTALHLWTRLGETREMEVDEMLLEVAEDEILTSLDLDDSSPYGDETREQILLEMIGKLADGEARDFFKYLLNKEYEESRDRTATRLTSLTSDLSKFSLGNCLFRILNYLLESRPDLTLVMLMDMVSSEMHQPSLHDRIDDASLLRAEIDPFQPDPYVQLRNGVGVDETSGLIFDSFCEAMVLNAAEQAWFRQCLAAWKRRMKERQKRRELAHKKDRSGKTDEDGGLLLEDESVKKEEERSLPAIKQQSKKKKAWEEAAQYAREYTQSMGEELDHKVFTKMAKIETLIDDVDLFRHSLGGAPRKSKGDLLSVTEMVDCLWHLESNRKVMDSQLRWAGSEDDSAALSIRQAVWDGINPIDKRAALLRKDPHSGPPPAVKSVSQKDHLSSMTLNSLANFVTPTPLYYGAIEPGIDPTQVNETTGGTAFDSDSDSEYFEWNEDEPEPENLLDYGAATFAAAQDWKKAELAKDAEILRKARSRQRLNMEEEKMVDVPVGKEAILVPDSKILDRCLLNTTTMPLRTIEMFVEMARVRKEKMQTELDNTRFLVEELQRCIHAKKRGKPMPARMDRNQKVYMSNGNRSSADRKKGGSSLTKKKKKKPEKKKHKPAVTFMLGDIAAQLETDGDLTDEGLSPVPQSAAEVRSQRSGSTHSRSKTISIGGSVVPVEDVIKIRKSDGAKQTKLSMRDLVSQIDPKLVLSAPKAKRDTLAVGSVNAMLRRTVSIKMRDLTDEQKTLARATTKRAQMMEAVKKERKQQMMLKKSATRSVAEARFFDFGTDPDDPDLYGHRRPQAWKIEKVHMNYLVSPQIYEGLGSPPLFFQPCLTENDYLQIRLNAKIGSFMIGLIRCVDCSDCTIYGDTAISRYELTVDRIMKDEHVRSHCMFVGNECVWNGCGTLERAVNNDWIHSNDGKNIMFEDPEMKMTSQLRHMNGEYLPKASSTSKEAWQYVAGLDIRVSVQCVRHDELAKSAGLKRGEYIPGTEQPFVASEDLRRNAGIFRVSILSGKSFAMPIPPEWLRGLKLRGIAPETSDTTSERSDSKEDEKAEEEGADSSDESVMSDGELCTGLHLFVLPTAKVRWGTPLKLTIL